MTRIRRNVFGSRVSSGDRSLNSSSRKTALVTAASGGLGSLVTANLLASGWRVFATMRDPTTHDRLDEAIAATGGESSGLTMLPLDFQDIESIRDRVGLALAETANRLDAIVPCAGVLTAGPFEETPASATRHVMQVNYFGVVETVRAALPALRAARGRIVLISSDSGFCGTAALASYTASKFALEGWGESLADELAPFGVWVSIIQSGPFKSGIYAATSFHHVDAPSPYSRLSDISSQALRTLDKNAPPAEPVVAAVMRALSAPRPKLRYTVGREARLLALSKRIAPEPLFRRIARRATGMSRW